MIKELRLGNFVKTTATEAPKGLQVHFRNEPHVVQITPGAFQSLLQYPNLGLLEPIPLTEEWLLRFGFAKDVTHNCFVIYQNDSDVDIEYSCEYKSLSMGGHRSATELTHITFVHQLQNLYFALTGEELTIKEPAAQELKQD